MTKDMTSGSTLRHIINFAVPLCMGMLFQQLYSMVDTMIVGKVLGVQPLAGVGATGSLNFMIIWFCIGICNGFSIPIAQAFGANKEVELRRYVANSTWLCIFFSIVITFFVAIFTRNMLVLLKTPEDIFEYAYIYILIIFLGIPCTFLYNFLAGVARALGDSKTPLFFLLLSSVINIILDFVLMIPIPLGVAGAAIATVISQLISCVLVLWCLYKTEGSYQLRFSKLRMKKEYLKQIFQVGIPAGVQSTVINFSNALLQSSVNSFGSTAMAGYTAANNILGFLYASINAVTQACMSFTSQNYGVNKPKRMDRVMIDCIILSVGVSLVLGCGSYAFGGEILKIYTEDPEVIRCGLEILALTTVTYFLCGVMDLFPGALRGMGASAVPMILSIIGTVGTRIVWIFGVFPAHRSLKILFVSYPASWTLTILMQAVCFYFVRKKVHRELKQQS